MKRVVYRADEVEIDTGLRCLRVRGEEICLRPQAMQVLLFLLENRERLVSRSELLDQVWQRAAVTDDALTQCIGDLRRALGDDPKHPRFIKTVPKLGFRFIATVEEPGAGPRVVEQSKRRWSWALGLGLIAMVGGVAWWQFKVPAAPAKTRVAVMKFEDRSGRTDLHWMQEGLADMLVSDLSRSSKLELMPREQVHQMLLKAEGTSGKSGVSVEQALAIGRRGQANKVIRGAFAVAGDGVRLDTEVWDVASGELKGSESLSTEDVGEVLTKFDALTIRVALAMGVPIPGGGQAGRLAEARTNNLEAFRAYTLGVEQAESFHSAEGLELFAKAIALDPNFAMAHARLGYAHTVSAGVSGAGKPHLERAFQLSKGLSERDRLFVAAWYALACEDYDQAIAVYREILERYPGEIGAYESLGRVLRGERRYKEAEEVLLKGRIAAPDWAGIENVLSFVAFELGKTDAALTSARRYVALDGKEANAHDTLGLIYQRLGRYQEALGSFEEALRVDPNFHLAYAHASNVYFQLGQYKEAADRFRKLETRTTLNDQKGRARDSLAWIEWSRGDMAALSKALSNWPKGAPEPFLRVVLEERNRPVAPRHRSGINGRGLRMSGRVAPYFAGVANLRNGHHQEALQNFRVALEGVAPYWLPDDFEDCLAQAYLKLGRADEAIAEYKRVLTVNPRRALARYGLGMAYEMKGDRAAARVELLKFLEIWNGADQELVEVREARERVGSMRASR